ncbi:hypothetical protein BCR33DRAFT_379588 [Rhizoclosmatium globosum]|uniref:Uncharacterized protein n=1 Tax=Rhizoclosmatium globosum TaxID=329046 RepID=A0A1Y2BYW8_9FUNG|nr:hypothetical protein BCR33DRAFT_379588 [Rhizoclosmatium globosum]|eukprot:ORY39963.1 hypothetical protein BCR33DRAFT_379588 [Rhizoclosmatium globosum]
MTSLAETVSLDESLDSSNYEDVGKIIDSGTNQPSNLESSVETLNNALNITPKKNPGFSIPIPQPFASATAIDTRGQQKSEPASTQPTSWLNNLGLFKMFDSPPKPSVVPVPQVLVSLVQEPGLKRCASTETFVSANSSAAAVTESEDLSSKTLSSAIPTTTSITALPIKLQLQELMESLESERLAHKETSIQLKTITETLNSETASKNQIQEELEKSNALIEELRNSLKQSNEFLLSQESSNKTLVQQISVMESHQTELNQQLESTKKELKSRDEELKGLTAAHPKKLNEVESTLNKKIKASEAKLLASVNEFNAYKKDAQVKEGEWKQKEKDLVTQAENAEEVVKNETAAKSVLEIELEKLKKELNEGKEGLVAEHKMAVEGLESRLNNAAEEGAAAKLKLESMEKKVTELEKREKEGLKKLKELEAIVQTGKSVVAALESDKKKLQDDLTASEKIKLDLALHVTKVKELELRNVELTKSVERLKEESSARGEAIESKEIRIKELEREMEDQESANQQVSDSLESAESKINQLESIVNQLTQQLQESRTSLETAQAHSQFLEGKLCIEQTKLTQLRDASTPTETPTTVDTSKYKSKISELEQQLSTLEATKAAAELQSKETSQSLETLKSTNEELQKTLIKAKIERRLRASRISELWNELQNAKKDGDEKTAELEKTRKMFMERVAALEEQIEQQSQQRQNVDVNQTRAQELESKLLEREAQIMRERDEWTQTQQKLLEGQQQKEVDVRMVREELNSVKESFKESCAKKDAMIRELTESLAIEKARISEDRSGIVSASNEPLSNEPGSLMSEVLSELMTQTVNQPDDHAIGKAWLEEWYKTRAPLESNNCLKEISQVLGTKLPESSNLETAKTEIIHSIETQKSRVTQLESVCRELEAFAKTHWRLPS